MTRLVVVAFLVWSVALSGAGYRFGVHMQANADQVEQDRKRDADAALAQRKSAKALAAGVRAEQAQANTDAFFQHLRADYETDQHNDPGIGCVLDPVSLRRWNDANAQSDGAPAGEPDDGMPQPAGPDAGPERGE